jgi:hypothetical protein
MKKKMTISYKWLVEKLTTKQDIKLVTSVEWRCYGVDEVSGFSAAVAGATTVEPSNTFIPYDQLTEQQVLDWCSSIKDETEFRIATDIQAQLAKKTVELALPWAQIPA